MNVNDQRPRRVLISKLIILSVMVLTVVFSILRIQPPQALGSSAAPERFSAARAALHVKAIASGPHMGGSPEQAKVRKILVAELQALGLTTTVQSVSTAGRGRFAAYVDNIVARLPGTASTRAILLMAHYDAVPFVPGASDNGASVAIILETLRALKEKAPLRNDVIVLFCDSEELYHQGSMAFFQESTQIREVGLVINFEGAGSTGPAYLLRSSGQNGWVVREFVRAASPRFGTSMFDEIFRRLPLGTDFDTIRDSGYAGQMSGLDLVRSGTLETYHTRRDSVENLNLRSVQDMGDLLMATLGALGNRDLRQTQAPDVIYFSAPFPATVVYPVSWRFSLAGLATLLFLLAAILAIRSGELRLGRLINASLVLLLRVGIVAAGSHYLWRALASTRAETGLLFNSVYDSGWYMMGFMVLILLLGSLGQRGLIRRLGAMNMVFGGLLPWLVLTWLSALWLPMGSYLFLWPTLLALVPLLGRLLTTRGPDQGGMMLGTAICLIPAVYLTVHLIYALFMALSLDLVAAYAALVILLGGALQPVLSFIATPCLRQGMESGRGLRPFRLKWVVPALGLVAVGICFLVPVRSASPSAKHPKPSSLLYALDEDTGKAHWLSNEAVPDAWTANYIKKVDTPRPVSLFIRDFEFPGIAAAPALPLSGPDVTVIGDEWAGGRRCLRLLIRTAPEEFITLLHSAIPERVTAIRINGKSLAHPTRKPPYKWPLWLESGFGRTFEVELTLSSPEPFTMEVAAMRGGLPGLLLTVPRPDWSMERPFSFPDSTVVTKVFSW